MAARVARGRAAALAAVVACASALVMATAESCLPDYDFGTTTSEGGATDDGGLRDGAIAEGSSNDASGDTGPNVCNAPPEAPQGPALRTLLDDSAVGTGTGNAQQQHLVYAQNGRRWWLFYLVGTDAMALHTRWSYDLTTWTEGAALSLPVAHSGEGRDFSVAYRSVGGVDTVHVVTSLYDGGSKRKVFDTRATIACETITFGTPSLVHDFATYDTEFGVPAAGTPPADALRCDPDGNSVAIGEDGKVYIATAWVAAYNCCECDSNVFESSSVDNGVWDPSASWKLNHFTVDQESNAHQLVALSKGNMLAAWEGADGYPFPHQEISATKTTADWKGGDHASSFVFAATTHYQAENDWSVCRIDDNHTHILRRKTVEDEGGDAGVGMSVPTHVFEHALYGGTAGAQWTASVAPASDEGIFGSGVVLLTNGASLLAATIGNDASQTVKYATWTDGGAGWSAWQSLTSTLATRRYLAGSGCSDPSHPVLTWTEGASPPYKTVGVAVSSLFPK